MAIKTTLEQLAEVQTAISKVLSGQSVVIGGKQLTRANLDTLTKYEQSLLTRYRSETGTGGLSVNRGIRKRSY